MNDYVLERFARERATGFDEEARRDELAAQAPGRPRRAMRFVRHIVSAPRLLVADRWLVGAARRVVGRAPRSATR